MKYDAQYWRGFIGGLRWVIRTYSLEWGLFHELSKKIREVKAKIQKSEK